MPDRGRAVNGERVAASVTSSGSLAGALPGPLPVRLPELTEWRRRSEAPAAAPGVDDAAWTRADRTAASSPIPPQTLPALYTDGYGFHHAGTPA